MLTLDGDAAFGRLSLASTMKAVEWTQHYWIDMDSIELLWFLILFS